MKLNWDLISFILSFLSPFSMLLTWQNPFRLKPLFLPSLCEKVCACPGTDEIAPCAQYTEFCIIISERRFITHTEQRH